MSDALREILGLLDVKVTGQEAVAKAQKQIDTFRATLSKPIAKLSVGERDEDMFAAAGRRSVSSLGEARAAAEQTQAPVTMLNGGLINLAAGFNIAAQAAGVAERIFSATVVPVKEMIAHVIELGDELDATSQRTGMSAREIQQWRFIAEKGNVDADLLTSSIGRLQRTAVTTPKAFHGLGIEIKDATGHVKSASDLFRETGLAIASIQNPAERTARAQAIFGRAGAALLPVFADGSASLEEMQRRFTELGGGLGDDVVKNAHEASDAMADWNLAMTTVQGNLARSLLPTLTHVIEEGATFVAELGELVKTSSVVQVVLGALGVAGAIAFVGLTVSGVIPTIVAIAAMLGILFLITEDVVTAFRGGDSVFGKTEEWFARMTGVTLTFAGQLQALGLGWHALEASALEAMGHMLGGLATVEDALGAHGAAGGHRAAGAEALADAALQRSSVAAGGKELAEDETRRRQERIARATAEAISNSMPAPATVAKVQAESARTAGRRPREWTDRDQRAKVHAPVTIHVHGAHDPDHVARVVEERIQTHFRDAADDIENAGDADEPPEETTE